jgi:pilus assembly protein CpaF
VVTLQDLFVFEVSGEDRNGRLTGKFRYTGLRPKFYEQARHFGKERELASALEAAERELR